MLWPIKGHSFSSVRSNQTDKKEEPLSTENANPSPSDIKYPLRTSLSDFIEIETAEGPLGQVCRISLIPPTKINEIWQTWHSKLTPVSKSMKSHELGPTIPSLPHHTFATAPSTPSAPWHTNKKGALSYRVPLFLMLSLNIYALFMCLYIFPEYLCIFR